MAHESYKILKYLGSRFKFATNPLPKSRSGSSEILLDSWIIQIYLDNIIVEFLAEIFKDLITSNWIYMAQEPYKILKDPGQDFGKGMSFKIVPISIL